MGLNRMSFPVPAPCEDVTYILPSYVYLQSYAKYLPFLMFLSIFFSKLSSIVFFFCSWGDFQLNVMGLAAPKSNGVNCTLWWGMRDIFRGGGRGVGGKASRPGSTCLDCLLTAAASKKVVSVPARLITKKTLLCQTSTDSQLQKTPQIKEHRGARKRLTRTTLKIA